MNIVYLFLILSVINVIFSTIRSIVLVSDKVVLASILSGGYYAFYNIVLIYSVAEFAMWQKCLITFGCNVVGVFVVKLIERKMRKDKLWKIEMSVHSQYLNAIIDYLNTNNMAYNYNVYGKHILFCVYAENQADSRKVAELVKLYNGKYFISENKGLLA